MLQPYSIRKANVRDMDELINFEKKITLMHEKLDNFYKEVGNTEREKKKSFQEHLKSKDSLLLVAEENGKLIGYILSYITKRPGIFKEKKSGHISSIYVLEKYQNKGAARSLVEETYKWFRKKKIRYIELTVHTKNKEGVRFWDSMGFETITLRKRKKL